MLWVLYTVLMKWIMERLVESVMTKSKSMNSLMKLNVHGKLKKYSHLGIIFNSLLLIVCPIIGYF